MTYFVFVVVESSEYFRIQWWSRNWWNGHPIFFFSLLNLVQQRKTSVKSFTIVILNGFIFHYQVFIGTYLISWCQLIKFLIVPIINQFYFRLSISIYLRIIHHSFFSKKEIVTGSLMTTILVLPTKMTTIQIYRYIKGHK